MKKIHQFLGRHFTVGHTLGALLCVVLYAMGLPARAVTTIDLADYPLFSTVTVPGNLALALSVEFPTAQAPAYTTTTYSASTEYIGYFNPALCYAYSYNSTTPANSYFYPVASASTHTCSGYWSGNYMNWASMHALDEFRSVLTGGYRSTDLNASTSTSTAYYGTILTKTYSSSQGTMSYFNPVKAVANSSTALSTITPLSSSTFSTLYTRTHGGGTAMFFSGTKSSSSGGINNSTAPTTTTNYGSTSTYSSSTIYKVYINVAVCVNKTYKEDNCTLYGSAYKPEGLIQNYALKLRYSAFGYLYDSTATLDGGVMRARMAYVGPTQPVPGSTNITNSYPEWSSSTGILSTNPVSADATTANSVVAVSNSGVINYINKFGTTANAYKTLDPVSELYYAVVRYFRGLSNPSTYTSSATSTTADGFPVITTWTSADPILYRCQKNFILGIGDVNTWNDGNLYGSTLKGSSDSNTSSPALSDTWVNVATATNMVGKLEGDSSLGSEYVNKGSDSAIPDSNIPTSRYDNYYIAGMAYQAHTVDLRSTVSTGNTDTNMSGDQLINTYWVDVLEGQYYLRKNQYYLAAKYGGFTVPSSFSPYSSSNGSSTLADSTWYTNSATSNLSGVTGYKNSNVSFPYNSSGYDYRPDNYFYGNTPETIKTSLTSAFAKIVAETTSAASTSYAMVTPNVTSGDTSYAATYDPNNWTSSLNAYEVTYDSSGNATLSDAIWDARDLLEAQSTPASTRLIATYCDAASTPAGIPFTATQLASCTSSTSSASSTRRLYYGSFSSINNTTSSSTTPQADYVGYLRGDRTNEISSSGSATSTRIYRYRKYLLGDIVNSKTTVVGAPSSSYYDVYNPGYTSFKSTYKNRRAVVYAGGNDGMVHAFDGTLPSYDIDASGAKTYASCSFCGQELFAYVPSFLYGDSSKAATSGLASLGDPSRSHYYMADATPLSFDIDFSNVCDSSTTSSSTVCTKVNGTSGASSSNYNWKTVLIGGLGHGGKGYYAIDVTHPGNVTNTTSSSSSSCGHTLCRTLDTSSVAQTIAGASTTVTYSFADESTVASNVLWEFPKSTDSTTIARMGYSYGAPIVVKTKKYGWVVVFTSGYNNSDGKGYFFFVNPKTGALLETVATSTGSTSSPLNLAQADAYIANTSDFTADAIYGGDTLGNLWRLDLTPTTTAYSAPTLMATLVNSSSKTQAVTTRPLIEVDPSTGKRYVLLGTGRLLASTDITSSTVQSIYSIYDGTSGFGNFLAASNFSTPLTYSSLNAISSLTSGISSSSANVNGWYYNLGVDSSTSIAERMNVNPVAYSGTAVFGVNLPTSAVCDPGGSGYVIGVNIGTGKTVLQDSSGNLVASSAMSGLITDLALQNVNGTIRLIVGDSKSNTVTVPTSLTTTSGLTRVNWRVVPTD